uniref:2'-phosphotransferase n=1 Tax=Bionectria ochroleuca TaxID=29856 RepID=A0A8H7NAG2_BIOOC
MADNDAHHDLEERAHNRSGGRRGGGGRRGRGGGGGGMSREVQISKALSRLLRHQAENAGITLDGEGYAPLDRVLAWGPLRSLQVSFEDIQSAVSNNEKQRFALKPNPATNPELSADSKTPSDYLIRANQGHSIKVESSGLLVPITAGGAAEAGGDGGAEGGDIPRRWCTGRTLRSGRPSWRLAG